ncbi:MAG: hypothetical protein VW397_07505, partial [Candidatus Margulisiibacteriota bacterium]
LLAYKENPNNNAMEDLKKFLIEEKQLASEELTKMAPEELILKYNQEKTILLKDIDTYITKNVLGITVDYKQQKN